MKATCPKCGRALRLRDWRPCCPYCGVHIVQYRMEERLQDDADQAELEYAAFRPRLDRCRAATIGSKPAVLRLCCALLPIAGCLLPLLTVRTQTAERTAITILDLFPMIAAYLRSDGSPTVQGVPVPPACAAAAAAGLFLLFLSLLSLLAHLVSLPWSCTDKGARRARRTGSAAWAAGAGCLALLLVCAGITRRGVPEATILAAGAGAFVYTVLLAVMRTVDFAVQRRGVPVRYTPCTIAGIPADEYRLLLEGGMTPSQIRASHTITPPTGDPPEPNGT